VYLFIHVPKTAGTSVTTGLSKCLKTIFDYGSTHVQTSALVRRYVYGRSNRKAFSRFLRTRKVELIAGHLQYKQYADLIARKNVFAFVRNPLDQVPSMFHHLLRAHQNGRLPLADVQTFGWHLEAPTLERFIEIPSRQNFQSCYLEGIDLEELGFFGLTERYSESVSRLRNWLRKPLPFEALAINPHKKINTSYELSRALKSRIEEVNATDCKLYERACRLFEERA